jgi:hypothetical protein
MREAQMRTKEIVMAKRIDWLAVAIGNQRSIAQAATNLGVSAKVIYAWLEEGLGGVSFDKVVKLSEKGDVPLEYLARRLGPWTGGPPPERYITD